MIYSKHGAEVIKERLVSKSQRYSRKVFISLFKFVLAGFVFLVVVAAGAGFGMMKGILDNAPDINMIFLNQYVMHLLPSRMKDIGSIMVSIYEESCVLQSEV